MALVQQDVIARLRRFIVEQVLAREEKLEDDTPLLDGGHLTSLQTLDLVAFIAQEYGVEIEPEEVDEEHFASLRTISALVCSKAP
jgi:methoxymalonate biosynthesis acyl carrier protein